jgi:hypothetical protein
MRKEFIIGEHFLSRYELEFKECIIPKSTMFRITEVLADGEYKVYFDKCIYNDEFKNNYCCKDEDGNTQIVDLYDIEDFRMSAGAEY